MATTSRCACQSPSRRPRSAPPARGRRSTPLSPFGSRPYSDRDIALLRRIQDLTNDGVSLAGVQRILALENDLAIARERIAELEARLDALQREAEQQVEAAHRQYRRDLVPVRSTVVARFEAHR